MLFIMGCSSCFGSNQYKKDVGCSSLWVAHAILGQTSTNRHELLFSLGYSCHFESKPYQMDMGCSSSWVTQAVLGQTNPTKRMWVTLHCGLLILTRLLCKDKEPTLIAELLGLLIGCSVALQRDPQILKRFSRSIH